METNYMALPPTVPSCLSAFSSSQVNIYCHKDHMARAGVIHSGLTTPHTSTINQENALQTCLQSGVMEDARTSPVCLGPGTRTLFGDPCLF
ncbi:uncharacterized protein LOC103163686 isoform X1 [Cricetulus griseus]|uniref:uncharacterized protein LOC103163686 isoform X1 n=1 Tax=Cricetulus griseus TaxID=10029 RepID=UPI0015C332D8|nr:uncharacterized protein LOC103163686 isoform X1 [Cricetulus griseus]